MTTTLSDFKKSVGFFSSGDMLAKKPTTVYAKNDKGDKVLLITDMPVFRSGVFRDSMGYQHTWEGLHINQMVAHFDHLKAQNIFAEVPVRKGHGSFFGDPMDSLIGWHTGLRAETKTNPVDGQDYTYLLASYEIFDEVAQQRISGGHWRNRSSEVGLFITNAEAEFWPVYQGVAYVDIPAVEGLNDFAKAVKSDKEFSIMMEGEVSDVATKKHSAPGTSEGSAGEATTDTEAEAAATAEVEAVAASTAETAAAEAAAEAEVVAAEEVAAEEAATAAAAVDHTEGDHGMGGSRISFSLFGQPSFDFTAVQEHIYALETSQDEISQTNRAEFVKGLATGNKIPATQLDSLTEFALELTAESYAKWVTSYESTSSSPLFGQYGVDQGDGKNSNASAQQATEEGEVEKHERILSMHLHSSMSDEKMKQTRSYKRLNELVPAKYPL